MKISKKIMASLLAINFAFMGLGQARISEVYAAEPSQEQQYAQQKANLKNAVDDYIDVVSSEAYNSHVSEKTKSEYEVAMAEGRRILDKGNDATFLELRQATARLQEIKEAMKRQTAESVGKKVKLQALVEESKVTINAVKLLFATSPEKVTKVRPQLEALIKKSEALIKKAEAIL